MLVKPEIGARSNLFCILISQTLVQTFWRGAFSVRQL
jgi:hypothetical protein